ncbi:MAG: Hpt domain-containing protein, partial [Planctomycetaceae bacterium]|nr:Hpt domain-containing protein [Planctomycetaceae bacterium]
TAADVDPSANGDVIDWDLARKNTSNDIALLKELVRIFLNECSHTLSEIRHAIETSDGKLLRRSAHTLRGSAAIFGALPVVDAALRLEMMGRENKFDSAMPALELLESRSTRLIAALQTKCEVAANSLDPQRTLCR